MTTSSIDRLIPVSPYAAISALEPVSHRPYAAVPGTRVLLSVTSLREAIKQSRGPNSAPRCGASLVGFQSLPCPVAVFFLLTGRTLVLLAFNPTDRATRELMQLNQNRQSLALALMDRPDSDQVLVICPESDRIFHMPLADTVNSPPVELNAFLSSAPTALAVTAASLARQPGFDVRRIEVVQQICLAKSDFDAHMASLAEATVA